jgi:hypothetical protein
MPLPQVLATDARSSKITSFSYPSNIFIHYCNSVSCQVLVATGVGEESTEMQPIREELERLKGRRSSPAPFHFTQTARGSGDSDSNRGLSDIEALRQELEQLALRKSLHVLDACSPREDSSLHWPAPVDASDKSLRRTDSPRLSGRQCDSLLEPISQEKAPQDEAKQLRRQLSVTQGDVALLRRQIQRERRIRQEISGERGKFLPLKKLAPLGVSQSQWNARRVEGGRWEAHGM